MHVSLFYLGFDPVLPVTSVQLDNPCAATIGTDDAMFATNGDDAHARAAVDATAATVPPPTAR